MVMTIYQTNDPLLRTALRINSFFSAITGLVCILKSVSIAELIFQQGFSILGQSSSGILFELGMGLLGFATFVLFTAQVRIINRRQVKLIT